jgi:hypothetical protein
MAGTTRNSRKGVIVIALTFSLAAQIISEEREGCHEKDMTMWPYSPMQAP